MTARLVATACLALVAVSVAAAGGGQSKALTFAPQETISPQVSSNWSGYVANAPGGSPLAFSDVTGSWVQPKARCVRGRSDAVAFWVGIGGSDEDSASLQQVGTAAECDSLGAATYYAWWEILPASSVRLSMKLRPGDQVTAAVLVKGQSVTMSLKNTPRRTRFSKTVTVRDPLDVSSAEWIAEAPTACTFTGPCEVVPLTNFRSVTFGNAAATANQLSGPITNPAWLAQPIQLIPEPGGRLAAMPGPLSADGRSFRVSWQGS